MSIVSYNEIINSIKKKEFAPVYFLDGDEPYFLDQLLLHFENDTLNDSERDFNLSILYGNEVKWDFVVSTCRRLPMFAPYQLVIIKDAAAMDGLYKLSSYVEQPNPSTILVVEIRGKKLDGKTTLGKLVKAKAVYYTSAKVKDSDLPTWIQSYGQNIGLRINPNEAEMLSLYLGSDLQKVSKELDKIKIGNPDTQELTGAIIHKYIGISHEYQMFEFPDVFLSGNKDKTYRMLSYFLNTPKAAPMVLVSIAFYTKFIQLYRACHVNNVHEKEWATAIGCPPFLARKIKDLTTKWTLPKIEASLMLLAKYNQKAVGINNSNNDTEMLKEFIGKLEQIELYY